MEASVIEDLLTEFQIWYDLDLKAKQKYQAQLAPDFRLIDFLQRDENALSAYLSLLLDPLGRHGQGDVYLTKFLGLFPEARYQPATADHKAATPSSDYQAIDDWISTYDFAQAA